MDGLDTYKKILELHPGQKAIIASGFSETDRVKKLQNLGAGAYIKKPFLLEKLGIVVYRRIIFRTSFFVVPPVDLYRKPSVFASPRGTNLLFLFIPVCGEWAYTVYTPAKRKRSHITKDAESKLLP